MRTVDRGPEPPGLAATRAKYTPAWVAHYSHRTGNKPNDSYWRLHEPTLWRSFQGLCGYCEEKCKGDVDHFRPKSIFPVLVYEWHNWVLACPTCNQTKLSKWPESGYVDPCERIADERPETYFSFDTKTGDLLPLHDQSASRRRKAQLMIDDLGLNHLYHCQKRVQWLEAVRLALAESPPGGERAEQVIRIVLSAGNEFPSFTRCLLVELGYL